MPVRPPVFHPHRAFHAALLASVSALTLCASSNPVTAGNILIGNPAASPVVSVTAQQAAAMQQAQAMALQSQNSLARATQALQALRAAQDAACNLVLQTPETIPNGLQPGGLVVDPRVTAGTDPSLWQNISQPSETTGNGKTMVTLTQSAQRAVATWQQFNVGRNTQVHFDQTGGNSSTGNSWIVLNRIDATGVPSQIQGQIKAEGTVLLINPNGIVFSGTSQTNVHSLIAAAMDLNSFANPASGAFKSSGNAYVPVLVNDLAQTTEDGTPILAPSGEANANAAFLANGLFVNNGFALPGTVTATGNAALFSAGLVPGQGNIGVQVDAGASITTAVSGFDNGGFVALLGPEVTNAGSINASAGQVILAADRSVQMAEPAASSTQTGFAVRTGSAISGTLLYAPPAVGGGSLVLNDMGGVLVSQRGNITLIGDSVEQFGLAEATTSITRAGSITIVANGIASSNQVLFGTESLTTILPEENGETIPSDPTSLASFTAPRIDIAAPYVDFESGSCVFAPSAAMTVAGPGKGTCRMDRRPIRPAVSCWKPAARSTSRA